MIYDCFSFYNEIDLLEIRLNILWDVVDKFVFTEATMTHTGRPKPLYFEAYKERFAKYAEKLVRVVVDDFPEPPEGYSERDASWMREDWQRNAVKRALKDCRPDDLIMVSDVDEIPTPAAVQKASRFEGVIVFEQIMTNYYLNFVSYTTPCWNGTKAARYKIFNDKATYAKMKESPYVDEYTNRGATASRLRHVEPSRRLKNAGWHFSYLGGSDAIVAKLQSIAQEYRNEDNTKSDWVDKVIGEGLDVCNCGRRFFAVPFEAPRFPKYLLDNREKYVHLIYEPDVDYYRRTRWDRLKCRLRGWIRKNGAKLIPRPFKQWLFDNVYCKLVKEPIVI